VTGLATLAVFASVRAAGIGERCAAVRISTVRQRYKWATIGTRERCRDGARFSLPEIFRRKREAGAPWRVRWSFGNGCDGLYERVPQRVLDDFEIGCAID
jgi:hypothetical protein